MKILSVKIIICLLLVVLTAVVYLQIRNHGPVNTDDFHLTTSKFINNAFSYEGLHEGMRTVVSGVWMPVIYITVGIEMELFGTDFGSYHLVAACFHALNAIMVFLLLFQMTKALWKSALVAAIFAVHPLNVEPVAWLACIRVLQSGFFCLLTLYLYILYTERNSSTFYTLSACCCGLSVFSVPMFPAIPFLMLLLDFWPLNRLSAVENDTALHNLSLSKIHRAVWEKFIFLGLLAIVLAVLILSHDLSMSPGIDRYPFHERFFNVLLSYVAYLQQTLLPVNLAVYYPFPESFPLWKICGSVFLLTIITAGALVLVSRYPFLIVGWLWFAGMMFPLSGIAQIGTQARADHYAYIPIIGLLILIVWGAEVLTKRWHLPRALTAGVSLAIIILLAFLSWQQAGYWKNSQTLMRHALNVTSNNYEAHNYLAQALATSGDLEGAVDHFHKALSIKPDHLKSHINLARVYVQTDRTEKAIFHYAKALVKNPKNEKLHNNLGALFEKAGHVEKALHHYRQAVNINPEYPVAYDNLAVLEANTGDTSSAIFHFKQALRFDPHSAGTHFRLGMLLHHVDRTAEAVDCIRRAIEIEPDNRLYRQYLSTINQK